VVLALQAARNGVIDHYGFREGASRAILSPAPAVTVTATWHDRPADRPGRFARDAALVTACTFVVATTGFVRARRGRSVEQLACSATPPRWEPGPEPVVRAVRGGVVQAVPVPTFVAARRDGGDDELGRIAWWSWPLSMVLAGIAIVVMALSPLIARLRCSTTTRRWPTTAADDPDAARNNPRSCSTVGGGDAALAARRRFAAAGAPGGQ
jgi:hypothetical protein